MIEEIKKATNAKTLQVLQRDETTRNIVENFIFLLNDFDFNNIRVQGTGRGSIIVFSKRMCQYPIMTVEYEMATLPTVEVQLSLSEKFGFSCEKEIAKYTCHFEIQKMIKKDIKSIDTYIQEIGGFWRDNEKQLKMEIQFCLEALANEVRSVMAKIIAK